MLKPLSLDRKPGLPPDGSPGIFLGWDAEGWPYLFWWSAFVGRWHGSSKAPDHGGTRTIVQIPVIVSHALVRREEGE